MAEDKATLRKNLKAARLALSADEWQTKSTAICDRLKEVIDWSSVETVHYFEPIATLAEVDINEFIVWLQHENQSAHCYTSRQLDGEWRVVSVAADAPVPTATFDVVLVPMLGFETTLHRIGYGGGYYDQFLARHPHAQKIGVCFDLGKVDQLPTEDHDIPLDIIVTEETTYTH